MEANKLLETIIEELNDINITLESPLIKTKTFATRIKNTELLEWVNKEINGYLYNDNIPNYRILRTQVKGNLLIGTPFTGQIAHNNIVLSIEFLNEKQQNQIENYKCLYGISALEQFAKDKGGKGHLMVELPSFMVSLFQAHYTKEINRDAAVTKAYQSFSVAQFKELISKIRNKLLDFTLTLESEFGAEASIEKFKQNNKQITTIMNQTIVENKGDGNLINTGDNNNIKSEIRINKGDNQSLLNEFKKLNIPQEDINTLTTILEEDKPDLEKKTLGKRTADWLGNLTSKVISGAVTTISIQTVTQYIPELLKQFFGI